MTSLLYGRSARLLFGSQVSDSIAGFTIESDGGQGLRISFAVTRSSDRSANKATIKIYNLSEKTRGNMGAQGIRRVVLEAGYQGNIGALICADRAQVRHRREGNEWVSVIEAGDGLRSLQSYVRGSYAPGSSARTILDDIRAQTIRATGLPIASRVSAAADAKLKAKVYRKGFTIAGGTRASAALGQVCGDARCRVSVQDCAISVRLATEAVSGSAVLLSPGTGLVGAPEHITERTEQGKIKAHHLRGQALIMAGLAPGRQVRVDSDSESGTVVLSRVDHVGDTHGGSQSWLTRWDGRLV